MKHTWNFLYAHVVWSTKYRVSVLDPTQDEALHALFRRRCYAMLCDPIAIGSANDHVHLLVRLHTETSVAGLVRSIKSSSAKQRNLSLDPELEVFRWQRGYGVISVRPSDVDRVANYVSTQRKRHLSQQLWPPFENTDDDLL